MLEKLKIFMRQHIKCWVYLTHCELQYSDSKLYLGELKIDVKNTLMQDIQIVEQRYSNDVDLQYYLFIKGF